MLGVCRECSDLLRSICHNKNTSRRGYLVSPDLFHREVLTWTTLHLYSSLASCGAQHFPLSLTRHYLSQHSSSTRDLGVAPACHSYDSSTLVFTLDHFLPKPYSPVPRGDIEAVVGHRAMAPRRRSLWVHATHLFRAVPQHGGRGTVSGPWHRPHGWGGFLPVEGWR